MKRAIAETERRRNKQIAFNKEHGIEPKSVIKKIKDLIDGVYDMDDQRDFRKAAQERKKYDVLSEKQMEVAIKKLEREMMEAARNLEFEKAAQARDELKMLRNKLLVFGGDSGNG